MTLAQILLRLVTASGPDRELDVEIAISLLGYSRASVFGRDHMITSSRTVSDMVWTCPKFTGSVDAAVGLAESRLPECLWTVARTEAGAYRAVVLANRNGTAGQPARGNDDDHAATTPALALCVALVMALTMHRPGLDER